MTFSGTGDRSQIAAMAQQTKDIHRDTIMIQDDSERQSLMPTRQKSGKDAVADKFARTSLMSRALC